MRSATNECPTMRCVGANSRSDNDTMPERNTIFNVFSGFFRLWIKPRRVGVNTTFDNDIEITRLPFPKTDRMVIAWTKMFLLQSGAREVVISLNNNGVIAFRNHHVLPNCLHDNFPENDELLFLCRSSAALLTVVGASSERLCPEGAL